MRSKILTLVFLMTHLSTSVSKEIYVDEGNAVTFDLPSFAKCGNYQFLNPQLLPLIIVKNQSAAAIQGGYVKRTSVYVIDNNKLRLTLKTVAPIDRGKYRVYTKTGDVFSCSKIHYYLNVKAKSIEYLSPWGPWSECSSQCDTSAQRTRERNCNVPGGCEGLGQRSESDTCQLHHNCPEWSDWSSWTMCRACGRGIRSRNRTCTIHTTTETRLNVSCPGEALQDEICQAEPCRVNSTFWSPWGSWGPCNLTCGGGYRQRTRKATFPQSEVVASFAGWSSEEERCNIFECEHGNQLENAVESSGGPSVVALVVGCAIVVSIIVLLIVILLLVLRLKKKRLNLLSLARSFRRSLQSNRNKTISTPEIPRKASEPNAYGGVKVGEQNKKRKSDLFKKDNKRESAGEIASTGTLSVDSISYTKRAKSGKLKSKKSVDNNGIRISGPIHKTSTHIKPDSKVLYDTPRSSKSLAEDEIKSEIVDADDTYEIPENPVWDGDVSSERTRKPEITVTESVAVAACHVENTNTFQIPKNDSSTGLSDFGSLSASSSPGYSSKFPSSLGLFSLYDTPRSSTSNLAEYIYDVPRNNDPLYENDNFSGTDEEFYVTPKISVSSMASV